MGAPYLIFLVLVFTFLVNTPRGETFCPESVTSVVGTFHMYTPLAPTPFPSFNGYQYVT